MKREYIKYRDFVRNFAGNLKNMEENTLYEIVGTKGITKGFFSLTDPYGKETRA